ncbi:MAG TPA: response regulator [Aggregatilineales bacterium]|nr:response regulator [Aggregatilineales bacterium]
MNERILIVDDDLLICELFRMMLGRAGYQIRTALSGRQTFDELEKSPVDLILLDVMMADSSGIEVLRQLRADARYVRTPIIIVTAMTESSNRRRSVELGANSVLFKPVDPEQLVSEVFKVLDARHQDHPGGDALLPPEPPKPPITPTSAP